MSRKPWAVKNAKSTLTQPNRTIAQFNSIWEKKTWNTFHLYRDLVYRTQLIEHYKSFAEIEAWAFIKVHAQFLQYVDKQIIVSDATLGLVEAVDNYIVTYGVNFEVFSRPRIRGCIYDGLRSRNDFPRIVAQMRRLMRPLFEQLHQKLHREPTNDEFCAAYGEGYREILNDPLFRGSVTNTTALSKEDSEDQPELTLSTAIARHGSGRTRADVATKLEIMELVNFIVSDPRDRFVVQMYYFNNRTSKWIAEALNLSQSSVVLSKNRAVELLKKNSDMFEQFLPDGFFDRGSPTSNGD